MIEELLNKLQGLWTVEFVSNFGTLGYGVAVFVSNRILGGDNQYFYVGDVSVSAENMSATADIKVTLFNKVFGSIFGDIDTFNLKVSGKIEEPKIELKGYMIENPNLKITIKCSKRSDLK